MCWATTLKVHRSGERGVDLSKLWHILALLPAPRARALMHYDLPRHRRCVVCAQAYQVLPRQRTHCPRTDRAGVVGVQALCAWFSSGGACAGAAVARTLFPASLRGRTNRWFFANVSTSLT